MNLRRNHPGHVGKKKRKEWIGELSFLQLLRVFFKANQEIVLGSKLEIEASSELFFLAGG